MSYEFGAWWLKQHHWKCITPPDCPKRASDNGSGSDS
jgi:hypothetical protein